VETVVHLAARAHVLAETETNPLEAFREVNTHGATALARACVSNGVRRLVFVSSIGVHGSLNAGAPFTEESALRPDKPYAVSKLEAEEGLREIAAEAALEIVILRPPLVYGPHVRGNFLRLLDWTWKRVPLPLGAVHNTRTFIGLDNLVDVLLRCVDAPEAAGQTFVLGDDETTSTAKLLRDIAHHFARPHRLFPCPPMLLRTAAGLLGRAEDAERLLGDLAVDTKHVRATLDWKPPVSLQEGLTGMCRWYRTRQEGAG
jgi:nucleoside-diphosphate-sugar epimerase